MSRDDWTLISLLVHVPAVTAWVGFAMLELGACAAPGLDRSQRLRLLRMLRWPTVVTLAAVLVTGVWQTMENPFVTVHSYSALERLRDTTTYGKALLVKHLFVIATIALSFVLRFVVAGRQPETGASPDTGVGRRVTGMAMLNVAACLGALLATARMTIELH